MSRKSHRPYTLAGAGALTATIWKNGDEPCGWTYRFNVIRTSATGRVSQRFHPRDLRDFVKLVGVLAFTLADDGCLEADVRRELVELAERLRTVLEPHATPPRVSQPVCVVPLPKWRE